VDGGRGGRRERAARSAAHSGHPHPAGGRRQVRSWPPATFLLAQRCGEGCGRCDVRREGADPSGMLFLPRWRLCGSQKLHVTLLLLCPQAPPFPTRAHTHAHTTHMSSMQALDPGLRHGGRSAAPAARGLQAVGRGGGSAAPRAAAPRGQGPWRLPRAGGVPRGKGSTTVQQGSSVTAALHALSGSQSKGCLTGWLFS
jgi:hypothetical protein